MLSPGQQSSAGRGLRCALGAARAEPGVSGAGGRREKKKFFGGRAENRSSKPQEASPRYV